MFDPNINTVELYINGRYFCRIVDPDISVRIESTENRNQQTGEKTMTDKESNISVNGHCDFSSKSPSVETIRTSSSPSVETIRTSSVRSNLNKDTTPYLNGTIAIDDKG